MAVTINSSIPKVSIGRVVAVARAFGSGSKKLSRDEISAKLNMKPGTGNANYRVIAAKKYGVIEGGPGGGYVLTELGRRIAKPDPARKDIISAIREVPHFAKLIDQLPTNPAEVDGDELRKRFRALGVPEGELDIAVRIFLRSWSYNGPGAPTELAEPERVMDTELSGSERREDRQAAAKDETEWDADPATASPDASGEACVAAVKTRFVDHPLVRTVLDELPGQDDIWSVERQDMWLCMLRDVLRFKLGPGSGSQEGTSNDGTPVEKGTDCCAPSIGPA